MFKRIWKNEEGVSPVIATILMVAITVVLAGVLVVYMQQFSTGPGTQAPVGSFVPASFTNPNDGGLTDNGGGWTVTLNTISGNKPALQEVKINEKKGAAALAVMDGITVAKADLSYVAGAAGTPKWYLKASVAAGAVQFVDAGVAKNVQGNEALLTAGKFETVEGAYFIFIDNNGDGVLNANDAAYVYKDHNGDKTVDISGSGYALSFEMGAGSIGAGNLA